jgi:hypothetical protein
MIQFITGKPGDGKTLFGTRQILRTLIETEKFVVTNIPLNLGPLNEYVTAEREKIERSFDQEDVVAFDLDKRLKVLRDEDVYEFYRHRSGGLVLPASPDYADELETRPQDRLSPKEFRVAMKAIFAEMLKSTAYQVPVEYHIDEAHSFFDSREWAKTGRGLTFYSSQHRHLHDEIFFYSQVLENVEKRLRGLASESHRIRNQLRRRIGPFKMRPVFKVHHYYGVPTEGSQQRHYDTSTFHLDPSRVAACYRTCGALGIKGQAEQKDPKGLPWWSIFALAGGIVLLVFAVIAGLPLLGAMSAKKMMSAMVPTAEVAKKAVSEMAAPILEVGQVKPATSRQAPTRRADPPPPSDLRVIGVARTGERSWITLSDGRIITERDIALNSVDQFGIIYRGQRIPFARAQPRQVFEAKTSKPEPTPVEVPAEVSPALPPPPPEPQSSWETASDGVSRLRKPDTLADLIKR